MPPLRPLLVLLAGALHTLRARRRSGRRTDAGEIVTWIILAAGLAVIALAVVAIIGAKLRSTAEGIQLE